MKSIILGLTLIVSTSTFATLTNDLKNIGDIKTVQNEKELREALGNKCLRDQLVNSDAAKARVVVGHRLTSLQLKVDSDSLLEKHISVEADYVLSENGGNIIPAGTEFNCTLDLSKIATK